MFLARSIQARDEALRFFSSLPQRWLVAKRTFATRQALVEEGSEADCMHVVERGWVKLTRTLPDGNVRGLGIAGPGSVIGLEASATYFSSAIALTPTQTYAIPQTVAWSSADGSDKLLFQINSQLIHMQSYVALLGISTAEQRLAAFLVGVSAYCGEAEDGTLELPMRRDDISQFLGIRAETVSRKMMDFHRKGWIEVSSRFEVRVLQPEVLRRFSSDFGLASGAA